MDKQRKKKMLREWQNQQLAEARAAFPIPPSELKVMFDMLDVELPHQGCNHTRRLTRVWLKARGHDIDQVFAWLDSTGGYCDCEVLANSEEAYRSTMGEG